MLDQLKTLLTEIYLSIRSIDPTQTKIEKNRLQSIANRFTMSYYYFYINERINNI